LSLLPAVLVSPASCRHVIGRWRYEDGEVKNTPPSINYGTYAKLPFSMVVQYYVWESSPPIREMIFSSRS
jgi:hypothetical protein